MKPALGITIGFALGFGCRYFGIPSPAPPVLFGALLVMAMTLGHTLIDHLIARHVASSGHGTAPTAPGAGRNDSHDAAPPVTVTAATPVTRPPIAA